MKTPLKSSTCKDGFYYPGKENKYQNRNEAAGHDHHRKGLHETAKEACYAVNGLVGDGGKLTYDAASFIAFYLQPVVLFNGIVYAALL